MRKLTYILLAITLSILDSQAVFAQNKTTTPTTASDYDPSPCNDPQIAVAEQQQNAKAYRDPTFGPEVTPLRAAVNYLAQKYNNYNINRAGACSHAPGVIFLVPNNLVGELNQTIDQIKSNSAPVPETFSGSSNPDTPNTPETPITSGPQGVPGTNIPWSPVNGYDPCHDYSGLNMNTPEGRAAAAKRCTDGLCPHNPDLERCKEKTTNTPPPQPFPQPVLTQPRKPLTSGTDANKPLSGNAAKYNLEGVKEVTVTLTVNHKPTPQTFKLDLSIGPGFPRNGNGVVQSRMYDSIKGYVPDPNVKQYVGDIDDGQSEFRVKRIVFTDTAAKRYGQKQYNFPDDNSAPRIPLTPATQQ
jgi:hypothetical protein